MNSLLSSPCARILPGFLLPIRRFHKILLLLLLPRHLPSTPTPYLTVSFVDRNIASVWVCCCQLQLQGSFLNFTFPLFPSLQSTKLNNTPAFLATNVLILMPTTASLVVLLCYRSFFIHPTIEFISFTYSSQTVLPNPDLFIEQFVSSLAAAANATFPKITPQARKPALSDATRQLSAQPHTLPDSKKKGARLRIKRSALKV